MKRPAWVARRIATQKALRNLPRCSTPNCTGRAMGIVFGVDLSDAKLLCVACAADAQREQREKRT